MKYILHSTAIKCPTQPLDYDEAIIIARALQRAAGLGSEVYICPLSHVIVSSEIQDLLSHEAAQATADNVTPMKRR